jgi:DNA-binding MarR family transcriptional regulator
MKAGRVCWLRQRARLATYCDAANIGTPWSAQGNGYMTTKDIRQFTRSPYHLLKRAAQYAADIYMDEVGKSGLTQRQYTVLFAVDQNDGISQTLLVKLTGIDRSTLADLVARLMAQGYLQRRRTRDDGRTNTVRITAAGRKALRTAQPGADEVDKAILAVVPSSHRRPFVESLAILASKLDEQQKAEKAAAERGRRRTR